MEIFDTHLRVVFKTTTSRGLEFPLRLTVSESTLEPHRSYTVFISRYINISKRVWLINGQCIVMNIHMITTHRTGSNVHIRVTDLQTSEVFSVPGVASTRLIRAFSASSFLSSATLHIAGTAAVMPQVTIYVLIFLCVSIILLQNANYSGCIGSVVINGEYINLWTLATDLGKKDLHPCSIK